MLCTGSVFGGVRAGEGRRAATGLAGRRGGVGGFGGGGTDVTMVGFAEGVGCGGGCGGRSR